MAAIHVAAIGIEEDGFAVRCERPLLDFAVARSKQLRRCAGIGIERVEMLPAILFAGDDEAILRRPMEHSAAGVRSHRRIRLIGLVAAAPDLLSSTGAGIGNPDSPGMRAVRLKEESLR